MQPTSSSAQPQNPPRVPQALKDLDTPPPLAAVIQKELARCYFFNRRWKRWIEEEFKLQYYYGGQDVVCLDTPEGRVVLAAGQAGTGVLRKALDSLSPEQRRRACVISLDPWDDDEVSIPSAFFDEA